MSNRIDVLHLTTSHKAEDNRITFGQAESLNKKYNVVVAGLSPRLTDSIKVKMLEIKTGNIFRRIREAFLLGIKLKPKAIQLHDPEMLLPGVFFRIWGIKIVFDFHEDYIQKWLYHGDGVSIKSGLFNIIEKISVPFYSLIIAADSHVFNKYNPKKTILIGNYPPLKFIYDPPQKKWSSEGEYNIVYLGTIHEQRGLVKCVKAINKVKIPNAKLHIIGESNYPDLTRLFETNDRVVYHGRIPWEVLNQTLVKMDVGLILLQPVPAFTYSPGENIVKLFEYAGLGIPFIISDFPGIRKFIERNGGGILVDPTNVDAIARAIENLYKDKKIYNKLSSEGRSMVVNKYNWEEQEQKLFDAYEKLLTN